MDDAPPLRPDSVAAQALGWIDEKTRAITPPIHVSTTFLRDPDNQYRSRPRLRARRQPGLRPGRGGDRARWSRRRRPLLFASGMAAATAVFQALAPGDHVLAPKVMYWSLRNWLMNFATQWGLDVELVDMTDPDAVRAAVRPGKTQLVWIETPANPLWTITDIAATAAIAHAAGALLAVDSTAATPVLTRPLEHGADIVMHSATKYLNGHSDLIAGALVTRERRRLLAARQDDPRPARRRRSARSRPGCCCAACARSTCACAARRSRRSASPSTSRGTSTSRRCSIRGCPTHPGHDVARRQMQGGFGGMLSIRVKGGEAAAIADGGARRRCGSARPRSAASRA